MPWYSKYFDYIIYSTLAFIVGISTANSVKNYKNAKKKPKFRVETNFKDTVR